MLENQHFSLTGICEIWLVSIVSVYLRTIKKSFYVPGTYVYAQ